MKKLIVYHGTAYDFSEINLNKSKDKRDFGKGFYTTTIQSQAESWAKNISMRTGLSPAYVYVYEVTLADKLQCKTFKGLTEEWLEFIKLNRSLGGTQHSYDIVIGPVADDNTMLTVSRYMRGIYTADEALQRLSYFKVNDQLCFNTEKSLQYVRLIRRYTLEQ